MRQQGMTMFALVPRRRFGLLAFEACGAADKAGGVEDEDASSGCDGYWSAQGGGYRAWKDAGRATEALPARRSS